ncbi:hypothetical protein RF11_14764 [Thelohanellus kitauei]|uniref:Uncharacterized protein n=1 Tax=Thelohanellus kitauei TaxID=669202 RepID=A0A0C2NDA4_THEKT|nr:hypothetical protein RF11_14764 [Thelohanellus kitauei]
MRAFDDNELIWVKNELIPGYKKGVIHKRTGEFSYNVEVENSLVRKHADQLKTRLPVTEETETIKQDGASIRADSGESETERKVTENEDSKVTDNLDMEQKPIRKSSLVSRPPTIPYNEYLKEWQKKHLFRGEDDVIESEDAHSGGRGRGELEYTFTSNI